MNKSRSFQEAFFLHFEWVVLATGLILMAFLDPFSQAESFCPVHRFGFDFCPGCGLGKSIAFIFRGEFVTSIQAHPAGLPAVLIIFSRIGSIFYRNHNYNKGEKDEKNIRTAA